MAERAGVPVARVSVFGSPGKWDAALIANQLGNAGRKAAFKSLVYQAQRDFDLKG